MSVASLTSWLLTQPQFTEALQATTDASIAREFPGLKTEAVALESLDWNYLLFAASVLARSETAAAQDAALRIAQSGLSLRAQIADACAIVLDAMSNRMSVDLAVKRGLVTGGIEARLGLTARVDWLRRQKRQEIELGGKEGGVIQGNRFQVEFWNAANSTSWLSVSAPTSAGKSFIIVQWIGEWLTKTDEGDVIYIVPTRALIQQVERDLASMRHARGLSFIISSVPMASYCAVDERNVLVFTQERYQIFLNGLDGPFRTGALIIDEAHKVGDGRRGVLLQDIFERTVESRPDLRVVFASPMTDNPAILLRDAPAHITARALRTEEVTVNQNLLWATQVKGRPTKWTLSVAGDQLRYLGTFDLPDRPVQQSKRLPFVAYALGANSTGNLLFANVPSDAETCAEFLYQLCGQAGDASPPQEIRDLQELVRATIHNDYALARVLERGVAFHYGNMPLLVRTEVERLFGTGAIKYLACTSTLMEGVNLPCRNLFVRGPRRGRTGEPLSAQDFWNLAGRAGRWGKEFQGNIICIDANVEKVWRDGPPKRRARYRIEATTERVLTRSQDLMAFLLANTPRSKAKDDPELEYMIAYLFGNHLRHGSIVDLPWATRQPRALIASLDERLAAIAASTRLPADVFLRNPGVSPIALENLYAYFVDSTGDPDDWLCIAPEDPGAVERYASIFELIETYLAQVFGPPSRCFSLAILVTQWMRGFPLKRLIKARIDWAQRKGSAQHFSTLIRDVMRDVEEVARFVAPKYLAAYNDVLRYRIKMVGRLELLRDFLDVNVLLEFGVPSGTPLSLMALGFSRTTAIMLSEIIVSTNWSERECLDWLSTGDWRKQNLPALVQREVETTLNLHVKAVS